MMAPYLPHPSFLVVGMCPSRPLPRPDYALAGRTGRRLADLCGISFRRYVYHTRRVNLVEAPIYGQWPEEAAKLRARELAKEANDYLGVLLLGRAVCAAFGISHPWLVIGGMDRWAAYRIPIYVPVPHPSGRNRWYNDPLNVARARQILGPLVGDFLTLCRETEATTDDLDR